VLKKQFGEVEDACLAQAMVDTVCEPLIVLEKDLRVIAASRSFYVKFAANPDDSRGGIFTTAWADPAELGAAAAFLASTDSSFMTATRSPSTAA
jgi:hypothetical protein